MNAPMDLNDPDHLHTIHPLAQELDINTSSWSAWSGVDVPNAAGKGN